MNIIFIDFEASALDGGYPIEVGYAKSDGRVGAFLIKPRPEWDALNWSVTSERIHRLPREVLIQGIDSDEVLKRLNVELQDGACFSTAPAYDWHWLGLLNPERVIEFRLMNTPADSLLMHVADESGISGSVAARIVDRATRLGGHTAAGDAAGLAAGYEILSRHGEIRMRDVEECFRKWQLLARAAAAWRSP
jgi:hypothetical protein